MQKIIQISTFIENIKKGKIFHKVKLSILFGNLNKNSEFIFWKDSSLLDNKFPGEYFRHLQSMIIQSLYSFLLTPEKMTKTIFQLVFFFKKPWKFIVSHSKNFSLDFFR